MRGDAVVVGPVGDDVGAVQVPGVDALAIARVTAREADLPPVRLTVGLAADLRALLDYRQDLVHEHHLLANQAHAELSGLVPGYQHAPLT